MPTIRVRELYASYRVREVSDDGITNRQVRNPSELAPLLAAYPACDDGARLDLSLSERVLIVLLDTKNRIRGVVKLSVGCADSSIVTPGGVFREAIRRDARAVILCHNHPSGDPEPSLDDITLTRQLIAAGALLGIPVYDHIVIGHDGRYVSLKERNLL